MDWIQVFTIVVSVFGLFLCSTRESASEIREIRKDQEEFQNFITSLFVNASKDALTEKAIQAMKRSDASIRLERMVDNPMRNNAEWHKRMNEPWD